MTKQEEILKSMTKELEDIRLHDYNPTWAAKWILGILSGLGVVIRVSNPRPDIVEYPIAVEPLIKE